MQLATFQKILSSLSYGITVAQLPGHSHLATPTSPHLSFHSWKCTVRVGVRNVDTADEGVWGWTPLKHAVSQVKHAYERVGMETRLMHTSWHSCMWRQARVSVPTTVYLVTSLAAWVGGKGPPQQTDTPYMLIRRAAPVGVHILNYSDVSEVSSGHSKHAGIFQSLTCALERWSLD